MALLIYCKSGEVKVDGKFVRGFALLAQGATIELNPDAEFEILRAQTIADVTRRDAPCVVQLRTDFPASAFLTSLPASERERQRWLLQTEEGPLVFVGVGASAMAAVGAG